MKGWGKAENPKKLHFSIIPGHWSVLNEKLKF